MFNMIDTFRPKKLNPYKSVVVVAALATLGVICWRFIKNATNMKREKRLIHSLQKDYDLSEVPTQVILDKFKPIIYSHPNVIDQFITLSGLHFKYRSATSPGDQTLAEDDPVKVAPEYHEVLWENDKVRVLWGLILAGAKEPMHKHYWPSILVMISASTFKITYADTTQETEYCPIAVDYLEPDKKPAAYENIGPSCSFLRFEKKP